MSLKDPLASIRRQTRTPPPRRICHKCGKPILRRHKWWTKRVLGPQHWSCRQPESY